MSERLRDIVRTPICTRGDASFPTTFHVDISTAPPTRIEQDDSFGGIESDFLGYTRRSAGPVCKVCHRGSNTRSPIFSNCGLEIGKRDREKNVAKIM